MGKFKTSLEGYRKGVSVKVGNEPKPEWVK